MPGRDDRLRKGYVVPDTGPRGTLAAQRRRLGRREEAREQIRLTAMLKAYLPIAAFWSSLENAPRSPLAGFFQRRRGVRSGLPDTMVIVDGRPVFIELKSKAGVASSTQKQVRAELVQAGGDWWLARSARAAMMALHLSGVPFRRPWQPPPLEPWEGPFADPHQRLPQHPEVAARRRQEQRRYRERQRARRDAAIADHDKFVARDERGGAAA
jgi:hypothetical protein